MVSRKRGLGQNASAGKRETKKSEVSSSYTHQRSVLPIVLLFTFIIAHIQRFQRQVDIVVDRIRFGELGSR